MIFADDTAQFAEEEVKQYQRLQKGKLVTVNQYSRKGNPSQSKNIEEKSNNTAVDNALVSSIKTGTNVPFNVAVAGLGLVGLAAGTRAFVIAQHSKQVRNAASRILTQPDIPDLRFLSKANPEKLPDDFSQYEGVIVATGGFGGVKGQHALEVHKYMQQEYPNHLVLSVENLYNDLGWRQEVKERLKIAPEVLWRNATQGNKTSEEMATLTSMLRKKTDKPITMISASGGGMANKEAQEITDQLGLKDIQGIGLGTPVFGLAQPKSPFIAFVDKKDTTVGWIPYTSRKDTIYINRSKDKVRWNMNPYQETVGLDEQHEFGTYLLDGDTRSKVDQIIYRNRTDKTPFKPENYEIDLQNNVARNKYIKKQQSQYSKLEQQAWANFNILFSSMADFAAPEQEIKVKSYIRNGKIVRAYSAKRDKALEDQDMIARLKNNITGNLQKKGVGDDTAQKLATGALVVGGVGVTLVGGKFLVSGIDSGLTTLARQNWDSNLVKRARMIETMSDDLAEGRKLFRGQTLRSAIGDAETVITVKGGINMNSKGGTLLKNEYLTKMQQRGDNWAILDLDNLELDSTGLSSKNPAGQTLKDWWEKFAINPFTKGYNADSIEMAAYMRAVEKIKPDANKVMIGYSAGGVANVAAASDISKLKNVSRLKAISFGVPYTGITKIEDTRIVDTVTFINDDDVLGNSFLSRGNKENINTIITNRPNKKIATDLLAGHGFEGYFAKENWDRIRRIINGGSQEAFK